MKNSVNNALTIHFYYFLVPVVSHHQIHFNSRILCFFDKKCGLAKVRERSGLIKHLVFKVRLRFRAFYITTFPPNVTRCSESLDTAIQRLAIYKKWFFSVWKQLWLDYMWIETWFFFCVSVGTCNLLKFRVNTQISVTCCEALGVEQAKWLIQILKRQQVWQWH